MLTIERPDNVSPEMYRQFRCFISAFLRKSGEDMTIDDVLQQIASMDKEVSALWFIHEDKIFKGYLYAEVASTVEGTFTAIHQLYLEDVKDRRVYDRIWDVLCKLGQPFKSKKLICTTKHNPKVFARLIKHGFKLDSYILSAAL